MTAKRPLRVLYDLKTHERLVDPSGELHPVSPDLFGYLETLTGLLPAVAAVAHWASDSRGQNDARCHERFHELVFVLNGTGSYELNGEVVPVGAGDVVLIKPDDVHRYLPGGSFDCVSMHASFESLDRAPVAGSAARGTAAADAFLRFVMEYYPSHHTVTLADPKPINEHVLAMVQEYRVPGAASELLIAARFIELLVMLARNAAFARTSSGPAHSKARDEMLVGQVTRFLDEHYAEPIDISRVFDKFFLHPNYCRNIFKAMTGMSVSAYLLRTRMARARELLLRTDQPIKAIAAAVGTPDYAYFQRAFRKVHGEAPGRLRREPQAGQVGSDLG